MTAVVTVSHSGLGTSSDTMVSAIPTPPSIAQTMYKTVRVVALNVGVYPDTSCTVLSDSVVVVVLVCAALTSGVGMSVTIGVGTAVIVGVVIMGSLFRGDREINGVEFCYYCVVDCLRDSRGVRPQRIAERVQG